MICPKCKRKYEDDMPKCLWCDSPNPNFGNEEEPETEPERKPEQTAAPEPKKAPVKAKPIEKPVEKPKKKASAKEKPQAKKSSTVSGRESGTLVFWLAFFGGFFGAHCFKAHRYRRGILYLLFGGAIYRIIFKILMQMGIVFPLPLAAFFLAATLVVGILYTFDIWKIACDKYRNHRTHHRYIAKPWMKFLACVAIATYAFIAYTTVNFVKDNIVKRGRPAAAMVALKMEAYTIAQEKYFQEKGKLGNIKEIKYISEYEKWMQFYTFAEEDNGIRITYLNNLNCPKGASWIIKATVVDGSLVWNMTLPADARCNAMAPQIKMLKDRLEKPLEPPASTPELDEGVDGVSVVPDTTEHGDSL